MYNLFIMTIENKSTTTFEMAYLGFARAAILFPAEHVLERVKLEAQVNTEKTSVQAVKDLWKSQGLKGLYAGSRANFIKRTSRETYHWPAMLVVNRVWQQIIPKQINKDFLITNIATGHTMALIQAGVTLPFERLFIEKAANQGYLPFIKKMIQSRNFIVYEGFQATLIRHSIVWDLFFISNHCSNLVFKKLDSNKTHPILSFLGKTLMTSTMVVGMGYPLEFLRNRILLEPNVLSQGTLRGMKTLFLRYKWTRLYSGVPIVLVHNFFQTAVFQPLIDKINGKA